VESTVTDKEVKTAKDTKLRERINAALRKTAAHPS